MFRKILKKINSVNRLINQVSDISVFIKRDSRIRDIEGIIRKDARSLVSTETNNICVSLTTYGHRIYDVHLVIESIGIQTCKPERIILWLDKEEFSYDSLPKKIKDQVNRGLEVKFCDDFKSYKKLIPSILELPSYDIVTIDDDIIYPDDMIERLIREHSKYPDCIIGNRAHLIKYDSKGEVSPYLSWEIETKAVSSGVSLFLTTGGGTLFPSGCFSEDICNHELFSVLAPSADDIWVYIMALRSNLICRRVPRYKKFSDEFIPIDDRDLPSLSNVNVDKNMNDIQFKQCMEYFNLGDKLYE